MVMANPHEWKGYEVRLLYTHQQPAAPEPKGIRVWGWVWKDKRHEDGCCYLPSYTPAQHVPKGELLALVDPADLHLPLENTEWHTPAAPEQKGGAAETGEGMD